MLMMRIAASQLVINSSAGMLASPHVTSSTASHARGNWQTLVPHRGLLMHARVFCILLSLEIALWPASVLRSGWKTWRTHHAERCLSHRSYGLDFQDDGRSEWGNSIRIVQRVIMWMNEPAMIIVPVNTIFLYS